MQNVSKYLFISLLVVGISSCELISKHIEPGDPPSVPAVKSDGVEMDLSFFEQNQARQETSAEKSNYESARDLALSDSKALSFLQPFEQLMIGAKAQDADLHDGVWEWSYSKKLEDIPEMEVRLTADPSEQETDWAMYLTFEDEEGHSYNDVELLDGSTQNDGSEADWSFYTWSTQSGKISHFLDYSWTVTSNTNQSLTLEGFNDSSEQVSTFTYERDEPEHTITLTSSSTEEDYVIFWNADTQTGYIKQGNGKQCWDENLEDTPC